jgi:hypothetical protein
VPHRGISESCTRSRDGYIFVCFAISECYGLMIAQRPRIGRALLPQIINALKIRPRTKAGTLRVAGQGDPSGDCGDQSDVGHQTLTPLIEFSSQLLKKISPVKVLEGTILTRIEDHLTDA